MFMCIFLQGQGAGQGVAAYDFTLRMARNFQ